MNAEKSESTISRHYDGDGAAAYFDYQKEGVRRNNWIAGRFFAPYISPDDVVVDFGCGTGWLLKLTDCGTRLGIEPNPKAREVASEIGVETVPAPEDVEDGFADVVISNHALEHSLSPIDELRQIRRIVKPDGKIVICLPIDDWRKQRKIDPDDPNHHLFTWTPLLFSNLLGEAGFEVIESRAFSYLQSPPNWRLDWLPRPLFDLHAKIIGRIYRYHQMVTVARPVS